MDSDISTKFMATLAEMMQYCCNKYVDFENFTLVTGSFYLSIDDGEKTEFIVNEKLCTTEQNRVLYLSNSYPSSSPVKPVPEKFPCLDMPSAGETISPVKTSSADMLDQELHTPAPPNQAKMDGQDVSFSNSDLGNDDTSQNESTTNEDVQVIEPKKENPIVVPDEPAAAPASTSTRPLRKRKVTNYNYDSTQNYIEEQMFSLLDETSFKKDTKPSLSETIAYAVKEAVEKSMASFPQLSTTETTTKEKPLKNDTSMCH